MNRTTKTIISYLGLMLALGGIDHGIFETLQGFTPTPGLVIQAIGPLERYWVHGSEEAFTIIPNFLVTGILANLRARLLPEQVEAGLERGKALQLEAVVTEILGEESDRAEQQDSVDPDSSP